MGVKSEVLINRRIVQQDTPSSYRQQSIYSNTLIMVQNQSRVCTAFRKVFRRKDVKSMPEQKRSSSSRSQGPDDVNEVSTTSTYTATELKTVPAQKRSSVAQSPRSQRPVDVDDVSTTCSDCAEESVTISYVRTESPSLKHSINPDDVTIDGQDIFERARSVKVNDEPKSDVHLQQQSISPTSVMNFPLSSISEMMSGGKVPPSMDRYSPIPSGVASSLLPPSKWFGQWDLPRYSDADEGVKKNKKFLALKKETEKNEFSKVVEVKKSTGVFATTPSQESLDNALQLPSSVSHERYDMASSSEDMPIPPSTLDQVLGILSASHSESVDSDTNSYYSDDTESIGDITIDSATLNLIEMHKSYTDSAKTNPFHPSRIKKSAMRVSLIEIEAPDSESIATVEAKTVTWYDDDANLSKPFKLKTDESFEFSLASSTQSSAQVALHGNVVNKLIPMAVNQFGKLFEKISCGGEQGKDDDLSLEDD